jgi:uncharacterized protein YeaO (DUF488 family)
MRHAVHTKRIYEPKTAADGLRVLVDRLWPRGVSKAKAALDLWMKEAAPSTELRKWFAHRPDRWDEFQRRYVLELQSTTAIQQLRELCQRGPVTLLYGAKDKDHNEAVALAAFLQHAPGHSRLDP